MVSFASDVLKVTSRPLCPSPPFPDFVVMRSTPLEALDPYKAAAAEPFSTVSVSMLFGSKVLKPLE